MRLLPLLLLLAAAASSSGCVRGLLYHDVIEPVVTDMNRTPNPPSARQVSSTLKRAAEPLTGLNIRVEVDSLAIGDAAKAGELNRLYYADMRRQSYLGGLWQKNTVIVTGE